MMDTYLQQFNHSNDSKEEINIKELSISHSHLDRSKSSMNISRAVSNSSRKSIQEKKEEFQERVQKLKKHLDPTKNKFKNKNGFTSIAQSKADGFYKSVINSGTDNFYHMQDGCLSPQNFQIGNASA